MHEDTIGTLVHAHGSFISTIYMHRANTHIAAWLLFETIVHAVIYSYIGLKTGWL